MTAWISSWVIGYILLSYVPCYAAVWFAAADGSETNGTYSHPWSPPFAVTNGNTFLSGGDTVIFKDGGTFACTETNILLFSSAHILQFRKSGGVGTAITYRPQSLWGFTFDGGLMVLDTTSNIVIRDFRITYSSISGRVQTNLYDIPNGGINEFGQGVSLMHNLIENTGHPGIGSWSTTRGKYIAGNVIRFIGYNDFTGSYAGVARGSGMYLQNAEGSPDAMIEGNVSYFNYTTGMKAYGNNNIYGFKFVHNSIAEVQEGGIFYHQDQTPSHGVQMLSNYVWHGGASGLRVGYQLGNSTPTNAVIGGNYVVDTNNPVSMADDWAYCTYTNNVFVNPFRRLVWQLGIVPDTGINDATHTMSGNSYYAGSYTGFGPLSLLHNGVAKTLAQWQGELATDNDATLTLSQPSGVVTFQFRPSTDNDFVHIVVFNWPTNSSTTVNLSSYFNPSDAVDLYDAQNIPMTCSTCSYNNGIASLDLTLTNTAPMVGSFTNPLLSWIGYEPRFRTFLAHRKNSQRVRTSAVNAGSVVPPP